MESLLLWSLVEWVILALEIEELHSQQIVKGVVIEAWQENRWLQDNVELFETNDDK